MASSSSSSPTAGAPVDTAAKTTHISTGSRNLTDFDRIEDGECHDDDYHGHLKTERKPSRQEDKDFTQFDRKDMKRMGKKQELRRSKRAQKPL